jgi:cyclic pyranopterin phosphate synthase
MLPEMARLTHVDRNGAARMVNVGAKRVTRRTAVARGRVTMNANAFGQLRDNRLAKGDALAVARMAGIQAAKRTAEWIPLCHTVPLDHVDVTLDLLDAERAIEVRASAAARWATGVEMEALVAVSAACLALYDMAKAADRAMTIEAVQLVHKRGGRSGTWTRRARRGARDRHA